MRRKKEVRGVKRDIRFNSTELEAIERGIHVGGLMSGDFIPLARFVRAAAVLRAYNLIHKYNRRSREERAELDLECTEN